MPCRNLYEVLRFSYLCSKVDVSCQNVKKVKNHLAPDVVKQFVCITPKIVYIKIDRNTTIFVLPGIYFTNMEIHVLPL